MLEHPANLRDVLAVALPELVDRFDFSRMAIVPARFLLENWRRREFDLLVRMPFIAKERPPFYVHLIVEQQSEPHVWMLLRTLLYSVLTWDEEWKAWETSHEPGAPVRLTPVIPIVLHTGSRPWRKPRKLLDLFDASDELLAVTPPWRPLFLRGGKSTQRETTGGGARDGTNREEVVGRGDA